MSFSGETKKKSDFEVLHGKILKPFSYILTVEELKETPEFKAARNHAFIASIGLSATGFFLPAIIGFCLSLPCAGTDFFGIDFISNTILSTIFCLPLSLAMIAGALPLYKKLVDRFYKKFGFIKLEKKLKIA
ncbi:MAG: hypothetical protein K5930_01120 [Treponemataceae bacterium]|nr:hypothetical protein [Treponemataceae bacterium]